MAKAKRFSLKGRGADIFFGDYAPTVADPAAEAETSVGGEAAEQQPEPASLHAPTQASKLASRDESKQASLQANKLASSTTDTEARPARTGGRARRGAARAASVGVAAGGSEAAAEPAAPGRDGEGGVARVADVGDEIWARIDASATITSSFRYTESELMALTDVLYELGKQHGTRVTKQDVARLGLNVVLSDYYRRGPSSLLGQLAGRRRRRPGG